MKLRIKLAAFISVLPLSASTAQLPAFPGADGAGQFATGGRGGIVYHVTRLNSQLNDPERAAPGTLLYGLNNANFPAGAPRTIVFDVAGVFHLGIRDTATWTSGGNAWDATSRQSISANNLTIAGQTAPGPVIIMGGTLKPSGSNIIIRNITVAAGYGMRAFWEPDDAPPTPGKLPTSFTMDAFDISGQNIILDHIDTLYCSDETISCNEKANNITIQYCISARGQNYQGHGYGHLLQPDTNFKLSFLHNLDAHLASRLPRVGSEVGTGALNDFRNNVIYNWINNDPGYAGGNQYSKNNFIQNFYLEGKGGDRAWNSVSSGGTGIFDGASPAYTSVYANGNLRDTNRDSDPNDTSSADSRYLSSAMQSAAYDIHIGVTPGAKNAFTNVLRYAGSRWWERDYDFTSGNTNAIDTPGERLVHEVITGTGRVDAWADDPYNSDPNEGVEWRSLWALRADANGVAPFNRPAKWDTDEDGMPDHWELEHSLDPAAPDNNADFDNDGYTNLEEYLNDIAAWPAPGEIVFSGTNDRYAEILNWKVTGVNVNISGIGNQPTSSPWQPSRYDIAVISNAHVVVDAVGQHAATVRLTDNATLTITNGWLKAKNLEIGPGCSLIVAPTGTLRLAGDGSITLLGDGAITNAGVLDAIAWSGTLPNQLVNLGTLLDQNLIQLKISPRSDGTIEVNFDAFRGHGYQLQARESLLSGDWENIGSPIYGTDLPTPLTTPTSSVEQTFYRVLVDAQK